MTFAEYAHAAVSLAPEGASVYATTEYIQDREGTRRMRFRISIVPGLNGSTCDAWEATTSKGALEKMRQDLTTPDVEATTEALGDPADAL